jgi:hypothetical protein
VKRFTVRLGLGPAEGHDVQSRHDTRDEADAAVAEADRIAKAKFDPEGITILYVCDE